MATTLEVNNWYWIPDKQDYVLPGLLVDLSASRGGLFRLEDGKESRRAGRDLEELEQLDSQCLTSGISNLIELHHLSEKAVLHILRKRFAEKHIYTFVSSILVAVNPFQDIPIYTEEYVDKYKNSSDKKSLAPHIFATADNAYVALVRNFESQSIVISGESGAGKTESIKLILRYIAQASRQRTDRGGGGGIQDQILLANPLMEAFGNAKTSRNNNSSRFGKLITLRFSGGAIDEAGIVSYLLEKCRVIHHEKGERNFHIFYELIAATSDDPDLAASLGFSNQHIDFNYARRSEVNSIRHMNELAAYNEVLHAMEVLGMNTEQRFAILRVVAGVLLLGNIAGDAAAKISNTSDLEFICDMLGLDSREMLRCLVSRNFGVRSVVTCMFTTSQAVDARDAFAKALYSLLFDWIIRFINDSLRSRSASPPSNVYIAMLDIFGFESFETNSFEQLLINYCNEKLQFHFNNHIFLMEQTEYAREGVAVDVITYIDNSQTLDLLEARRAGLLSMIDEEINVPKGTDDTLLNKIFKTHEKAPNLRRANPKGDKNFQIKFVVSHYAGEVAYSVTNFLDKNKDALSSDLFSIGALSADSFVQDLFVGSMEKGSHVAESSSSSGRHSSSSSRSGGLRKTMASQFKTQLTSLIDTLNETEPHFVRCMKSNMEKVGNNFDSKVMLTQLRYSGLIEVCRIRQNGFPNRILYDKFIATYWMLNSSARSAPELVRALEIEGYLTSEEYFVGHTKIFLKYETGLLLEQARNWAVGNCAVRVQRIARGCLARRRLKRIKKALVTLTRAISTRDMVILQDAVSTASTFLPNQGRHIALVRDAISTLRRMEDENYAVALLQDALGSKDMDMLENAVKHAREMKPPLSSPLVRDAMNALKDVKTNIHSMVSDYNHSNRSGRSVTPPPGRLSPPPPTKTVSAAPPPPPPPCARDSPPPRTGAVRAMPHILHVANKSNGTCEATGSRTGRSPPPPSSISRPDGRSLNRQNSAQPPVSVASRIKALQVGSDQPPPPPPPSRRMIVRQESRSVSPPPSARMRPPSSHPRCVTPPAAIETSPFFEEYQPPPPPPKGVRTSILTRQLSKEEFDDISAVHQEMEALVTASCQEEGITEEDVSRLERALAEHSTSDVTEHISQLMMAKEELSRARKQLSLQRSLGALTDATPTWKMKNLIHQATQIGMENYIGIRYCSDLIEEKAKKQARKLY